MPVVPAGLKVWQLAQALARKTDFPFAELLDAGFVFVVVATLVVATVLDVAGAATVMVRVTVRPPELECPIAQPTTPAGTSNAKNRSQTKTSPTVTAGSRFRSAATAERYRPVPARVGTRTIRLLAAMIRRETLKPCPQRGEWSLVAFPPKRDKDSLLSFRNELVEILFGPTSWYISVPAKLDEDRRCDEERDGVQRSVERARDGTNDHGNAKEGGVEHAARKPRGTCIGRRVDQA